VLFLYREEYYLERKRPDIGTAKFAEWTKDMDAATVKAEVIVDKHRYGSRTTIQLQFDGSFTRFADLAFSWSGAADLTGAHEARRPHRTISKGDSNVEMFEVQVLVVRQTHARAHRARQVCGPCV
jgi:hypothetical protein